jgi:anti-sigma-K factor RskA
MGGRVLPFDGSEHAAADVLLPFYANDTLVGEEREFVQHHLASCDACRREVKWLRTLFTACSASPELQDAAHAVTANRLAAAPTIRRPPRRSRVADEWRKAEPWTRWLIAAQLAAIVLLGAMMGGDTRDAPAYHTLGAGNASTESRNTVAVMFDPAASAAEIRRVVHAVDGRIVDGPSSLDVFVVEVPPEHLGETLTRLRGEPSVRLAEPLALPTRAPAAKP